MNGETDGKIAHVLLIDDLVSMLLFFSNSVAFSLSHYFPLCLSF